MINYNYSNIPQDWLVADLGKVAVFEDGKRIPLKEEDRSKIRGKYPYYGASGIIDYVNDYLFDQERILFAEDGANILMRSTPVAFKATGKYWVNNHAHVLKPNDNTNIDYLTTYLESLSYIKFNTGSTQPKLNRAICNKIPVLLPPLPEQKAIADLLSSWDEAIEKTERLIQTKEQFKIGQLQELITNNKANSTIEAFAKPIIRKVTKPSKPYVALGIRSHFKGTFQRNVEDPNSLRMDTLYKVKKDDLIVNITFAWEGAIALVKEEDEKCYVSHRFPTYRIIQEKAEASFVRQLILSSRMKYDLSNISPGGAGRNRVLNKKDFLKMPIWIPDLEKQKNIGELLGTLDQEIDLLKHLAEKYKTQKQGLMQKLLTGEWRVKPEILNKYKEA